MYQTYLNQTFVNNTISLNYFRSQNCFFSSSLGAFNPKARATCFTIVFFESDMSFYWKLLHYPLFPYPPEVCYHFHQGCATTAFRGVLPQPSGVCYHFHQGCATTSTRCVLPQPSGVCYHSLQGCTTALCANISLMKRKPLNSPSPSHRR